jgi:hypothetical protein
MKRYWIGLGLWGGGLVFVWWLSKGNWQVVTAIATWFLALGVAYAFLQVQQARRSTNAQIAVGLFENLRDEKILKTEWDIIYKNDRKVIKGFLDDDKKKEETEKIGRVLDWLDILGILVKKDIVDKDLAIMGFAGVTAVRCWYRLVDFIREMQSERKRGFYAEYYEDFTHECMKMFGNQHIKVKLQGVDGDLIELIEKLPE